MWWEHGEHQRLCRLYGKYTDGQQGNQLLEEVPLPVVYVVHLQVERERERVKVSMVKQLLTDHHS